MSIPVPTALLAATIDRYGPVAFVVSVSGDGRPHCVSAVVDVVAEQLRTQVGRTSAANAAARPDVTLLWPPTELDPDHSLIVDGQASVEQADGGGGLLVLVPTRAVQHRRADADEAVPHCIPIEDASAPTNG